MTDSVVIVEGKRDSAALRKIGFSGKVLEFHKFGGMINFVDSVAKHENLISSFFLMGTKKESTSLEKQFSFCKGEQELI